MKNTFFKDKYEMPETSNYMKLTEGEHTFRVMSSAIVGYEYFTNENKPVRSEEPFEETPSIKDGGLVKHFWSFVVYNYQAKKLQILNLTQKTIMEPLKALVDNPKWGSIFEYDIVITRKGMTKNDTTYSVVPNPKEPVSQEIQDLYDNSNINLNALYEGGDPWGGK